MRLLIVEDDPRMLELLCQGFREVGHTPMPATNGESGLDLARDFEFDAMVLDIGLPGRDGYSVARELRAAHRRIPILMLTARDSESDILQGFDLGADDYLTKPFSFRELLARLHVLTRDRRTCTSDRGMMLDPVRLTLRFAAPSNESVSLTRSEFLLLSILVEHKNSPVPRRAIFDAVWGPDHPVSPNALEVLVNSLRGKVEIPASDQFIATVRGVGYCLESDKQHADRKVKPLQRSAK
jgi:DNA-binding response OmpR family regulator